MQAGTEQVDTTAGVEPTEEVVRRALRRDASAFELLIRRYERTALSVAFAVVQDATAAGDVAQEAFVRAWQRLADLKEPSRFGPWLCGIVRNLAADVLRRNKGRMASGAAGEALDGKAEAAALGPLDELGRREDSSRLAAALDELDETSRTAVVLRYYEDLSSKQIGELLGLAPAAVDMRLMRARRQLRERLGQV